jgi:uncharacterized protein (TIGR03435 family)
MQCGVISNSLGPGTIVLRGDPLKIVLTDAFKVKGYQIAGPSWLDEDCFEIVAKMPEGATQDQMPAMLQALLIERFKLAAHKEDRPRPIYALVLDKGGPKFTEAKANFRRGTPPGQVMFRATRQVQGFKGQMTMARLAQFLAGRFGRPVQDFTGLTGTYGIDFAWATDPTIERVASPGTFSADSAPDAKTDLPAAPTANVFTALRESLGLKLEPRQAPVEILVIDRVERIPTEN